jgi:hypothetical protein
VNEFQETPFKDQGRYIRLLVPTGNYIKAQGTEFNGNLQFQTLNKQDEKEHARLLNRLTWNYNGKSTEQNVWQRLSPFLANASDTELIALQSLIRNLVEYETRSKKWLFQYTWQSRSSKSFFTSGFDLKTVQGHQVFIRNNPGASWQIRLGMEGKKGEYKSEFIPANSYQYQMLGLDPNITFQPGNRFRIGGFGKVGNYTALGVKIASLYEGGIQWNQTLGKGSMLEAKASMLQAAYFLQKGTPLAYEVLQGFSAGKNFRGVMDLRFNAAKNIQMVMSYEARKTADARLIHVGRAEARYLF